MFYFSEEKYDFCNIYTCIHKFYRVGSMPEGMDSFYNSHPELRNTEK